MNDSLEGAIPWLKNRASQSAPGKPFFLVVSLVNPHDLKRFCNWNSSYYSDDMLVGSMNLPPTWNENKSASYKPKVSWGCPFSHIYATQCYDRDT
jgi:hypothetical protein